MSANDRQTNHGQIDIGSCLDIESMRFSRDGFASVLNQTFHLHVNKEKSIPLKLVALVDSSTQNPGMTSFSCYFAPPADEAALPDDCYFLENADLGKLAIFLSATPMNTGNPRDYEYEAVFNLRDE